MTELKYWLWATLALHQNAQKLTALLEHFSSPEEIYRAEKGDFQAAFSLPAKDLAALCDKSLARAEAVMDECRRKGIRILTFDSPYYPRLLANIFDPPYVLYVKSRDRIDLNQDLSIAVVGTRKMTQYGRDTALCIAGELARAGVTVVSGMARGIDGAAHTGALRAGGRTVAVLGCGADVVYPPEHADMMKKIAQTGLVLSEYPPGARPLPQHFPTRNRIISGLCLGTVIVESPESGGSLITANLALEQGRDVFAVPGDIDRPPSEGTNELIRQGAHLISSALDIISEYREEYINIFEKAEQTVQESAPQRGPASAAPPPSQPEPLSPLSDELLASLSSDERCIIEQLSLTPCHVDLLAEKTGLDISQLNAALTLLEVKGLITQLAGRHFVRKT